MRIVIFFFVIFSFQTLLGQSSFSDPIEQEVDSLIQQANQYSRNRQIDSSMAVLDYAGSLSKQKLGEGHPLYLKTLQVIGKNHLTTYQFTLADSILTQAKLLTEQHLGSDNEHYAEALAGLGVAKEMQQKFEEARVLHLEALNLRKKLLGPENASTAKSMRDLALTFRALARHEEALELFEQEIKIKEKLFGKTHVSYLGTLINWASELAILGKYEVAEPLFLTAIHTFEDELKIVDHPFYFTCLLNLSNLYSSLGRFQETIDLLTFTINHYKETFGSDSQFEADALNNLANTYNAINQDDQARESYEASIRIFEKTLGRSNYRSSAPIQNSAYLFQKTGDFEEAEKRFIESIKIRENTLGKSHYYYAESLDFLGRLYIEMKKYNEAEELLLEAANLREKQLGKDHRIYLESASNLSKFYWNQNPQKAEQYFLELATGIEKIFVNALKNSSERDLLSLEQYHFWNIQNLYNYLHTHSATPALTKAAYNSSLLFKGFLLEARQRLHLSASNLDPQTQPVYKEWIAAQRRLAIELTKPIDSRNQVENLEKEINELEKELATALQDFDAFKLMLDYEAVKNKLQPGEIAIEFIQFEDNLPLPTENTEYAALILRPEDPAPVFVPLFEEKELQVLLQQSDSDPFQSISNIYDFQSKGKNLYDLVWKPLEPQLQNVSTIYFSPAGLLHKLNLNALPINDKSHLKDQFTLVQLNSTRYLIQSVEEEEIDQTACLFGGINYETDSTRIKEGLAFAEIKRPATASRGTVVSLDNTSQNQRNTSWAPLQWTEIEVETLGSLLKAEGFQTTIRTGYEASEDNFRLLNHSTTAPGILHLATHGYFFPDPAEKTTNIVNDELVFRASDHPMIRSGLILAGANQTWRTGEKITGLEDGILTAYEISQMNLSNTRLVVLSACETGLGDIDRNEGVYGLQRAFKIAGAKNLIMSLWQVPRFSHPGTDGCFLYRVAGKG